MSDRPNIVLILNDDMGYSDIHCYGGEVDTPNLDRLAENGIRFTQFYNTARCSPSRASLLTGLHPHQTGVGVLTYDQGPEGYPGDLNRNCVTVAEVLKQQGYRTYMSGKWHVARDLDQPSDSWPLQRGFDKFYGTIIGAGSYYYPNTLTRQNENVDQEAFEDDDFFYTDTISKQAVDYINEHTKTSPSDPFFLYVAYTAPHWPLHAHESDALKYKNRFNEGWDRLRQARMERMRKMGILDSSWELSERDPAQTKWEDAGDKEWLLRCMEVYAAQIDRMDQGIGAILTALQETGRLDNTIVMFLSDNGGCAEPIPRDVSADEMVDNLRLARSHTRKGEPVQFGNRPDVVPGPENTYQSYGVAWANLSNTPFRYYKHWVHEGGISTPFIVHWPDGIQERGVLRHTPAYLPDVMATIVDISGATYPDRFNGKKVLPCEGTSIRTVFEDDHMKPRPLFWEHEGNAAVRIGNWKLVRRYPGDWELYDMVADRTEMHDLASQHPDKVREMSEMYLEWANRCRVIPREKILEIINNNPVKAFWDKESNGQG
ncbi:arylsulfatase [Alicyclobacillus mengziensis]|uniref:Arylsulfatase n=1 Tax=Alicyclobacillus mengziensis TaxID=2931921 RepID=A0A9X7VZC5_9BACL|nr:arylsulfatase [Alicyclobacillus mengziensis]QSO47385.1 arylsulfatase [Alicyclobacillus mengziensis]